MATAVIAVDLSVPSASRPINVLVTTFAGLGLPRTLSIPVPPVLPICDLRRILLARLPAANVQQSYFLKFSAIAFNFISEEA